MSPVRGNGGAATPSGEQTANGYLGYSGWHYDHWPGVLYNTRHHYIEQHARFFRSVEVNSTFYQFPKAGQLKKMV